MVIVNRNYLKGMIGFRENSLSFCNLRLRNEAKGSLNSLLSSTPTQTQTPNVLLLNLAPNISLRNRDKSLDVLVLDAKRLRV